MKKCNLLQTMSLQTMSFTKPERTNSLQNIIHDYAVELNCTPAAVEETILAKYLLPKNETASCWITKLYAGEWDMKETLLACFAYLTAGINNKPKYNNALELVRFLHQWECIAHNLPNTEHRCYEHFLANMESIVQYLRTATKKADKQRLKLAENASYASELFTIASEEPEYVRLCNVYQLIMDNWDVLHDWSGTYSTIHDMILLQDKWINTTESRLQLTKIVKKMTKEW